MAAMARLGLILIVLLATAERAYSWGHDGHIYVCVIAQGLLTDKALAEVKKLLPTWANGYMPTVCPWADVVGHTKAAWRWSLPLHYIDTPDGLCNYDFSRDCHATCVAAAILNYTSQLTNVELLSTSSFRASVTPSHLSELPSRLKAHAKQVSTLAIDSATGGRALGASLFRKLRQLVQEEDADEATLQVAAAAVLKYLTKGGKGDDDFDPAVFNPTVALMFLVHFVGDIHQPLHVGFTSDYGGNRIKVHWYKKKTNLHEVWDTEIIKHGVWKYHANNATDFALSLATRLSNEWSSNIQDWVACDNGPVCPNKFAGDSIKDACQWAYKDVTTGDTLQDVYFESRFPIVEVELAKAGVRLAATLNRLFDGPTSQVSA